MGKQWKQWQTLFSWAPKSLQMVTAAMKWKDACSKEGKLYWPIYLGQPREHIKKWTKVRLVKGEIQPVHSKGDQSWVFIGGTDAEAEAPILWPPDAKNWLIGKDSDAVKDWRQEEKGTTEDKMVGWHHRLDGREPKQALGVGDGEGSLVCRKPWGRKESDMT